MGAHLRTRAQMRTDACRQQTHARVGWLASAKDCAAVLLRKITQRNPNVTKHAIAVHACRARQRGALSPWVRTYAGRRARTVVGTAGRGVREELRTHLSH
jgi:hypothetical protein